LNIFRTTFRPSHLFFALLAIFLGLPEATTSTSRVTREALNREEESFLAIVYLHWNQREEENLSMAFDPWGIKGLASSSSFTAPSMSPSAIFLKAPFCIWTDLSRQSKDSKRYCWERLYFL